ncbi:MAG: hypothetical protein IKA53_00850 [Clostridia bacterium]|nr:hypothetical protein [Clostridia bacterium]MBR2324571.1 hypothetical protein [Clostridia bacterium]
MYARSYEKNDYEQAPPLPSGYRGTAFENEGIEEMGAGAQESIPASAPCEKKEEAGPLSFLDKIFPKGRMRFAEKGGLFGALLSDTEDILLLGVFLLLLLSKEGDPLCAVAVLILLISDKI